jgi:hypothetical protein
MKRRRFFKAMAAAPLAPALIAQQTTAPANNNPAPASPAPPALDPTVPPAPLNRTPTAAASVKLETAVADDVAEMAPKFFNATQMATLRKLSVTIMPSINGAPGAEEAEAADFLDFLIGESPRDRQQLYTKGLDLLNAESRKKFGKGFAEADASQIAALLAPLKQPWTYDPPTDPIANFLRAAKQDIRTATLNSREYASAASASGSRRGAGVGLYWFPLD